MNRNMPAFPGRAKHQESCMLAVRRCRRTREARTAVVAAGSTISFWSIIAILKDAADRFLLGDERVQFLRFAETRGRFDETLVELKQFVESEHA
jgi:hypothetical protein